jgi:hypothetical protein
MSMKWFYARRVVGSKWSQALKEIALERRFELRRFDE